MTRPWTAKTGDTRTFEVTALADGAPINAPGATATWSVINTTTNQVVIYRAPVVVLQTNPLKMRATWDDWETEEDGAYGAEFRVTLLGGGIMTLPSAGLYPIIIGKGI